MAKKYCKSDIVEMCNKALKENVSLFYTKPFVNYLGTVKGDDQLLYSEVVAEFVLTHIDEFKNIKSITRKNSYKIEHDGSHDENTNRLEEKNAMEMFLQSKRGDNMQFIGKIVDYQTPLKAVKKDKAGKIDLLAEADDAVYILELKKEDSTETMLRCVLEGYTYLRVADHKKLLESFDIDVNKPIYAAPFVFKGSEQWKELQGEERKKHPMLIKLMDELDIKGPFYIVTQTRYNVEK